MKRFFKVFVFVVCLFFNYTAFAEPLNTAQVSVEGIKPGTKWAEIAQRTDLNGGLANGAYEWDLYQVHRIQFVGFDLGVASRLPVRAGFRGLDDDIIRFIDVLNNEVSLKCGATVGWSKNGVINLLGTPHFANSKEFGYDVLVDEVRYVTGKVHFYVSPYNIVEKIVITDGYYDI